MTGRSLLRSSDRGNDPFGTRSRMARARVMFLAVWSEARQSFVSQQPV